MTHEEALYEVRAILSGVLAPSLRDAQDRQPEGFPDGLIFVLEWLIGKCDAALRKEI